MHWACSFIDRIKSRYECNEQQMIYFVNLSLLNSIFVNLLSIWEKKNEFLNKNPFEQKKMLSIANEILSKWRRKKESDHFSLRRSKNRMLNFEATFYFFHFNELPYIERFKATMMTTKKRFKWMNEWIFCMPLNQLAQESRNTAAAATATAAAPNGYTQKSNFIYYFCVYNNLWLA